MESIAKEHATSIVIRRCAALFQSDGTFRIYSNPTIGDIRILREKGAIILHLLVDKRGALVEKVWVTDMGIPVVIQSTFV